jgi:hypothetical protein
VWVYSTQTDSTSFFTLVLFVPNVLLHNMYIIVFLSSASLMTSASNIVTKPKIHFTYTRLNSGNPISPEECHSHRCEICSIRMVYVPFVYRNRTRRHKYHLSLTDKLI